ncbi:Uu.00g124260.m01.CDS01 [Anthostomella pinea]|uniref:Uu.00g124260.m01.CDS01 n=1 Tax=Anthostomella pinea TaxID=933095 RepID=A0AAI8VC92_9PEZI|nr:Uu.00g124260.m01.CDS01 [Anthostomella pinea]
MPAATEGPTVSLSFANNFWGREDAGVGPLLDRMASAKQTSDELRSFYSARASIENDYAHKLMSLSRKSLGSHEMGTLKSSLDTVRGEVEQMAKQHGSIAAQMKTELEEPLAAFAGGMKERRKIVQNTVEKLLKVKIQQTQMVNKTRDRYEQECLKIKGYLAQGHMVMGQEERKNKAKLEKTQISLATSNSEYESAVKALEDTTGRWNREWKAAADKFQDLEEERLDFSKSSLWTFANIASTVCVSDDASCEKIRISLEKMDVEKDILNFINERGTGQEIPDAPKYINFCRGDVDDHQSEVSDDDNYSVAQFPRNINPAFRTSSPQPSTFESHHDPNSMLARDLAHQDPMESLSRHQDPMESLSREATLTPHKVSGSTIPPQDRRQMNGTQQQQHDASQLPSQNRRQMNGVQQQQYDSAQFASVPHDPYPMHGMTMLCRTDGMNSATSSNVSARPLSRDDNSEYSNPTSFSSQEPPSGQVSPTKQEPVAMGQVDKHSLSLKKKSGFFQNHSPFRRKSTKDVQPPNRNTWGPTTQSSASPRRPQAYQPEPHNTPQAYQPEPRNTLGERTASPDPIDANASLALNVGQNVFPVANTDKKRSKTVDDSAAQPEDMDPIALALAELKGAGSMKGIGSNKQSAGRISADHYHGIATPAPDRPHERSQAFSRSVPVPRGGSDVAAAMRGTPPPSYDQPVQRLGVPPPACTSKAMQESSRKYTGQTRDMFNQNRSGASTYGRSQSRPAARGTDMPRATSPAAPRSASPRPGMHPDTRQAHRSASPNPYSGSQHHASPQSGMPPSRGSDTSYQRHNSPNDMARGPSPSPYRGEYDRPVSRGPMAVQLAPAGGEGSAYGSARGRGGSGRPGTSSSSRGAMSFYDGRDPAVDGSRQRSKSVADPGRQYTPDGRAILHYARALYMYQAAIPEELGFAKGDTLAVLRHQDDGWWEAEIHAGNGVGRSGLVPSNYLQPC